MDDSVSAAEFYEAMTAATGSPGDPAGDQGQSEQPAGEPKEPPSEQPGKEAQAPGDVADQAATEAPPRQAAISEAEYQKALQLLETYRNQVAHYQRLYEEARKTSQSQPQLAEVQGGAGEDEERPATYQELMATYKPDIDAAISAGLITEDTFEAVPDLVVGFYSVVKPLVNQVQQLQQAVNTMMATTAESVRENAARAVVGRIAGIINELAGEGDDFAMLRDEKELRGFAEHIVKQNPQVAAINKEWIAGEWMRYKADMYREALKRAIQQGKVSGVALPGVPPPGGVGRSAGAAGNGSWLDEVYDAFVAGGVR